MLFLLYLLQTDKLDVFTLEEIILFNYLDLLLEFDREIDLDLDFKDIDREEFILLLLKSFLFVKFILSSLKELLFLPKNRLPRLLN